MAVAKVALSLPEPLVTRIDRLAKKAGLSRSAFVRQAVERILEDTAQTDLLRKWLSRMVCAFPEHLANGFRA